MFKYDSMFATLSRLMTNPKKIALLVIDEDEETTPREISNTPYLFATEELNEEKNSNVTACQQRLLMYMQANGCPVWSINTGYKIKLLELLDPSCDLYIELVSQCKYNVTRTPINALYNGSEHSLIKSKYNAFNQTTLHYELKKRFITHLVVMGVNSNVCVNATVGMEWWPLSLGSPDDVPHDDLDDVPDDIPDDPLWANVGNGATHLGYIVMTCDQILHGQPANWSNKHPPHYKNLEFYSKF
ncbi:MAG: isochorismatase family protein [Psychromonas sp.]|nr:isochorismatase family protein [Psychromonas sp.]